MLNLKKTKLLPILMLICGHSILCKHGVKAFDSEAVTRMLKTSYACHKGTNPAMAVAVVKNGQLLFSKGFGVTNLKSKKPVTDDTLFGVASITKSLTAALFLKLLNEKTNLTLNSRVREFVQDAFVMPDAERTYETTFVDMLSHKTAMLSNNFIRLDDDFTRRTILSRLAALPSNRQFRVDHIYSNLMYGLIARFSEVLGGEVEWEQLITNHLFKPLGMSKSTFATKVNFDRVDLARGYSELDGPNILSEVSEHLSRLWGGMPGSGSVISTVKDIAKWMNFYLTGGKNAQGDQVLTKEQVKELYTGRFHIKSASHLGIEQPTFPITVGESAYALGLRVGHYRGYPHVAHTGGTHGYKSYMVMLPTENIGAVVFMTGTDTKFRQRAPVIHYLIDSALELTPYLNESTICSFPYPWVEKPVTATYRPRKTNTSLAVHVDEYKGNYYNSFNGYEDLSVDYNDTLGSLQMSYGWGRWELLIWPNTDVMKTTKEQRLYGKAIGPNYPPDVRPIYFIAHPDNSSVIVGMRATAFEKMLPPIFCKQEHNDVCEQMAAELMPATLVSKSYYCPNSSLTIIGRKTMWPQLLIIFLLACLRYDFC